jgi:glycosyltransferase involved in cell wall biosynthesis
MAKQNAALSSRYKYESWTHFMKTITGQPSIKFSVVLPIYQVMPYVVECIESIQNQSYQNFEVIAIDDGSDDGSGDLLDAYAAHDQRIKVTHLGSNIGLGPARNVGIAKALGDYLVFIDGDDYFESDALDSIANRLRETGDLDVLIYDFARRDHDTGKLSRDGWPNGDDSVEVGVFELSDRPEYLHVTWAAWNKTYRRSFISEYEFTFSSGYYEDESWTPPILLTAKRIAILDRICLHYRKGRPGSITKGSGEKHLDIFNQYSQIFAFLQKNPEYDAWRSEILNYSSKHLSKLVGIFGRIPIELMGRFDECCVELFTDYPEKLQALRDEIMEISHR